MDVACQFQEIGIVFTDDRFVSVLKEMARPFVSQIKVNHITGEKLLHTSRKRLAASSDQYMEVVGEKGPCIHDEIPVHALFRQPVKKILAVSIGTEYICPFGSPPNHMMQCARGV